MVVFSLFSSNPKFSRIINKNPSNPLVIRALRHGSIFGFYSKVHPCNQFVVYFREGDGEISYKENKFDQFDYLTNLQYFSPACVIGAFQEFFSSTYKNQHDDDLGDLFENQLDLSLIYMSAKSESIFKRLIKYFPNLQSKLIAKGFHIYSLEIKSKSSIYEVLNISTILLAFITCCNTDFYQVEDSFCKRLTGIINNINAPYYIRYLAGFQIFSKGQWSSNLKELSTSKTQKLVLHHGDTHLQRQAFIRSHLHFDKDIVDIGCGPGQYALKFCQNLKNHKYFAMDVDSTQIEIINNAVQKKKITNIETFKIFETLKEACQNVCCDIILTEVIEHMAEQEASNLLKLILENLKFDKFIITTPNQEFNDNYIMESQFRHDDHKWEANTQKFQDWLFESIKLTNIDPTNFQIDFVKIGDRVNDVSVTQGAIIKSKLNL